MELNGRKTGLSEAWFACEVAFSTEITKHLIAFNQNLQGKDKMSLFGLNYFCEQIFSLMIITKSELRTRLTHDNQVEAVLRLATTNLAPNIEKLVAKRQC